MRFATALACALIGLAVTLSAHADTAADKQAGMDALTAQRYGEAADIYRGVVAENPEDGEAHYRLAMALMAMDALDEAAMHFQRAGELGFQPLGVGYRLARIHARQGETDAALTRLEEIAAGGFPAPAMIENEADFAALADEPRYRAALATIQGNRYKCRTDPNRRAFDFWVGKWDVTANGQPAGTNDVRSILGDCVVFENWTGASGLEGKSFNYYDPGEGRWNQVWVDDTGSVIEFSGEVRDGNMHYTATTRNPATGAETLHRLTFFQNADGSVRQLWEQSSDEGQSWAVVFDGHYVQQAE